MNLQTYTTGIQHIGVPTNDIEATIAFYQKLGFEYAESNPELELNDKVQNQWQYFKTEQHKRRRCFVSKID